MKLGKIGKLNQKEHRELAKLWVEKGIEYCEYNKPHMCSSWLTNAHRHKKLWYRGKPDEMRWSYKQVLRLCMPSHMEIEYDNELTEKLFQELRGDE